MKNHWRIPQPTRLATYLLSLITVFVLTVLATRSVRATEFVVDTASDDSFDGNSAALEQADGAGLSLREAIGLANQNAGGPGSGELDGDTISFSPTAFLLDQTLTIGSPLSITDDLVIDGTLVVGGLPVKIMIDAGGSGRILEVDSSAAEGKSGLVALTEIVLANGASDSDGGGALVMAGSALELRTGSEIRDCVAEDGGGIYSAGSLSVNASVIAGNVARGASGSGGGIFNAAGGMLSVSNSTLSANLANRAGGAIEDQAGAGLTTIISDVEFAGNNAGVAPATAAPGNGGAIHITGPSDMAITGGAASANLAAREGGAFWNGSGTMTIEGTRIESNVASGAGADDGGGGVFNNGGTLVITGALISENVADGLSGSGGGVFSTTGDVTIGGQTVLRANLANRAGGGIEVIGGTLTLAGVQLGGATAADGNVAGPVGTANPGNGGGLHVSGSCEVSIAGGDVAFNLAAREGGGLWNQTGSTMTLTDGVAVVNNTASGAAADDGGGGIFNNGGDLIIDGSASQVSISDNIADGAAGSGGGIQIIGGSVEINDALISGNRANRAGGGIEDASGAGLGLVVKDSILTGNNAGIAPAVAAPGSGGGLHITGAGDASFEATVVSGNIAASEGGGFWNGTGTLTIVGGSIVANTASGADASNGGGGIFNAGGELSVRDGALIDDNVADGTSGSGGGIFNDLGGIATISDSTLSANRANRAGGGIEDNSGPGLGLVLTNVRLEANNAGVAPAVAAPGNGGAIHISGPGDATITGGAASMNVAALEGGALWNGTGLMSISGGVIDANSAAGDAAHDGGGGIFNNGGAVTVENGTIISNNLATGAAGSGGGIFNQTGGTLVASGVTLVGNRANRAGGGIEDNSGAGLGVRLTGVDFLDNNAGVAPAAAAPGNGGAIHITGPGDMEITGGLARGNLAAAEGGGFWNGTGTLTISGTALEANIASGSAADQGGGALFNAGGLLEVRSATLEGNVADGAAGSGGGIFNDVGSSLRVISSSLARNVANRAGGGIEDNSGAGLGVVLEDVEFSSNNAGVAPAVASPGNGGAVHISGPGDITITGGSAMANIAAREGGAYWNGSGAMTVEGGSITANIASGAAADDGGGGLFNNGGSLVVRGGVTIAGNVADGASGSGGGIFNNLGGVLSVTGSEISSNVANRAGGGIEDNAGARVDLSGTLMIGNTAGPKGSAAPGNGGAFHVTGAGTITIDRCHVDNNTAGNEGGGLWNSGAATMAVSSSAISNSSAPDGGGLFQQAGAGTLLVTNSTVSGNSASNGGGIQTEGGTTDLVNVTLASNSATTGGGANILAGVINLRNTVIADNTAISGTDLNGAIATASSSLLENPAGSTGISDGTGGNIVGADPQLAPLADNGGGIPSHFPAASSVLVDAGANALITGFANDQRGPGFARIVNSLVDIGSIEVFVLSYDDWAARNFGPETPLDQRGPGDNPDSDARSNALEWLSGSDPENGSDGSAIQVVVEDGNVAVRYSRMKTVPPGVESLEQSADLAGWIAVAAARRSAESQSELIEEVTLSLSPGKSGRVFNRIMVITP